MIPEQPEVCDCSGSCAESCDCSCSRPRVFASAGPHSTVGAGEGRDAGAPCRALRARERAGGGCARRWQGSRPCRALRRAAAGCARGPLLQDPGSAGSADADAAPAARAAARRRGGIRARGQVSARVCILCSAAPVRAAPRRLLMTLCCTRCRDVAAGAPAPGRGPAGRDHHLIPAGGTRRGHAHRPWSRRQRSRRDPRDAPNAEKARDSPWRVARSSQRRGWCCS